MAIALIVPLSRLTAFTALAALIAINANKDTICKEEFV
jgi:hypothetical protein